MAIEPSLAERLLAMKPLGLPIIDSHGHLGTYFLHHIPHQGAAEQVVAMMDTLGFSTVCFSHCVALSPDFRDGNRLACEAAAAHPGRLAVYLVFNPNYPAALSLEHLARLRHETGVIGVKLHPTLHQAGAGDSRLCPAYEFARNERLIMLSHTWGVADIKGIEQMAKKFPEVPIIIGHSGGNEFAAMEEAIRVARECANAYLDLTLSWMFEGVVELFVREAGADKVLFGTDIPFMDARANLGRVIFARISDADKEKILVANMRALLASAGSG